MSTQTNPKESSMSTMTMIHMGAELVVAAAIVYWIHSKNKETYETISALEKRLDTCETIIEEQTRTIEILKQHIENFNKFIVSFTQQRGVVEQRPQRGHSRPTQRRHPPAPNKSRNNISQTFNNNEQEEERWTM